MQIVPHRLFKQPGVHALLSHGSSCILYKRLPEPAFDKESYLSASVISMVLKGEQRITTYEGDLFVIPAGNMIYMPRDLYTISDLLPDSDHFESLLFFLDDGLIQQFISDVRPQAASDGGKNSVTQLPVSRSIQRYVDALKTFLRERTPLDESFVQIKLLELLHLLRLEDSHGTFERILLNAGQRKRRNLISLMENNFDKPLRVEDYACLSGRSLSSFRRDFKRLFGTTPQQWLKQKRLEKALQLLGSTKMNVTQVAFDVGYENISYFIQEFRKRYNISPKQFVLRRRIAP